MPAFPQPEFADYIQLVRIDLLGTIGVHGSAESGAVVGAALGGRRAQLALASLALCRQVLPPDTLADHIWGDQPPPTWPVALRGLIGGLRRALAPIEDGTAVIFTDHGGYRMGPQVRTDVDQAAADLERATQLAAAGRSRSARDLAEPISRLGGSQLLVGEDADWIRPHRRRVDALALHALEVVVKTSTELGDHRAAAAAARQAVANSGLDERSHRALIRALDAAGDRAGAVQAYDACRAVLADELGIDPSAETTQTYLAALGAQSPTAKARLPFDTSSFHGRADELATLAVELASPGLLAIVGRGGVGKTRLTLETVSAATHFTGGRFWVSLASLGEDDLVASTVAVDMGVAEGTDDPTAAIAAELAPLGRTLLVLDGCEQVIDGAASLAGALMASCPALTMLATSRVPLSVDGAKQLSIAPFPVPATDDLTDSPLVALLAARVADGGGRLRIDDDHAPHLQALLAWCAGLPLAVELVAGQLAGTSVADLLDALPAGDPAGVDTLRGVTSSSYALLGDDEAAVFRRFAVLDGEVALPMLRKVVSGGAIPALRVVRILRELTARGLISVDSSGAHWRYHQDDDLRRFAGELLVAGGEEREAFDRLGDAVRSLLPDDPRDPPAPFAGAVTDALANVRSLLRAGVTGRADRDRCLELAFRLHRYWAATNVGEGRFWLARLLAAGSESQWTAYATYALGYLDYWSGATDDAVVELQTVVRLLDPVDDPYKARALIYLAGMLDDDDRGAEAVDYVRRSMTAAAPFGPDLQVAAAMGMGSVLSERGLAEAATHAAAAIELCRAHGSAEELASAMPTAAMISWQVGALDDARSYIAEALPMHQHTRRIARVVLLSTAAAVALADREGTELGVEREMPLIRSVLSLAKLATGNHAAALDRAAAALDVALEVEFTYPLATCLETAALVLATDRAGGAGSADVGCLLASAASIRTAGTGPSLSPWPPPSPPCAPSCPSPTPLCCRRGRRPSWHCGCSADAGRPSNVGTSTLQPRRVTHR